MENHRHQPCSQDFVSKKYVAERERQHLLNVLLRHPADPWPGSSTWTFRNGARVYGSPMFDEAFAALASAHGYLGEGAADAVQRVLKDPALQRTSELVADMQRLFLQHKGG